MQAKEWADIYEEKGRDYAIQILVDIAKQYERLGVRVSLCISQFLAESYKGEDEETGKAKWSGLFLNQNNLHGIKDPLNGVLLPTYEVYDGVTETPVNDKFAVYPSIEAGILAYAIQICATTYYWVRVAETWQEAVQALNASPYATDPRYGKKNYNYIKNWHLYEFDSLVLTDRKNQVFLTLHYRGYGERVKAAQELIKSAGYDINVTEVFDDEMFALIKDFQRQMKMLVDGVYGIRTQLAFEAIIAAMSAAGTEKPEVVEQDKPIEEVDVSEKVIDLTDYVRFLRIESKNKKESEAG